MFESEVSGRRFDVPLACAHAPSRPEPAVFRWSDGGSDATLGRHPRDGPGRRGHRVRLGVDFRPPGVRRPRGRMARFLGVVDATDRDRRLDRAGDAGHVRDLRAVPQSGAPRQDGRDARRGQRRPGDPRASAPAGTSPSSGPTASRSRIASIASRIRSGSSARCCAPGPRITTASPPRLEAHGWSRADRDPPACRSWSAPPALDCFASPPSWPTTGMAAFARSGELEDAAAPRR